MSSDNYLPDNFYQLHDRKGKFKAKHNNKFSMEKIIRYKKKQNIDTKTKVSEYDVYKFSLNKKRKNKYNKNIHIKGYDYKLFVSDFDHNFPTKQLEQDEIDDISREYDEWKNREEEERIYWIREICREEKRAERSAEKWAAKKYDKFMW